MIDSQFVMKNSDDNSYELIPFQDVEDEFSGGEMISARPRRISELNNPPTQIIPIPPASSFIVFSQTNRFGDYISSTANRGETISVY